MHTLAEAERLARQAIARRQAADRAARATQAAEDVARRLAAAQAVVDTRRRRKEAVRAVLRSPRRIPIRGYPQWLAEALRDTNEDDRTYMIDRSTPW